MDKIIKEKWIKVSVVTVLIIFIACIGGIMLRYNREPIKVKAQIGDNNKLQVSTEITPPKTEQVEKIEVHIKGQVNNPGIVVINEGQRLHDAIALAGGATDIADLDAVNLAAPLSDGESKYIPAKGETPISNDSNQEYSGKININTANRETLMRLPGIGEAIAEDMIEYREQNNHFGSIDEIMNVKGIGEKKFDDLKDLINIH